MNDSDIETLRRLLELARSGRIVGIAWVAIALGGCVMPPMSDEERAHARQMELERQRFYQQQQLEAQKAMLNRRSPFQQPQAATAQPGVSASWTGRSQMAQSVTGASGFNCEYSYGGRTFWRMFASSCPSSVQVN